MMASNAKEESSKATRNQTACRRCGECCKRGGPALHEPDMEFIRAGAIPLNCLYTIRPGERAYDNVNGGLFQVTTDIVKIKSHEGSSACVFYDDDDKACRIYAHRPLECRLQACWDNSALEGAYTGERLSRKMILENSEWLRDMIDAHEARCHFEFIHHYVEGREAGDLASADELTEIVNYDVHFREIAVSKGNMPSDLLDFLLGRPLAKILQDQFGVKINHS